MSVRTFSHDSAHHDEAGGAERATQPYRTSSAQEWVGEVGEHVRFTVRVEHITSLPRGLKRYLVKVLDTGVLLEWSSTRRYGIAIGDRLGLSGLVKSHEIRDGMHITVLRDCYNPLRLA